jgi:hypothetical protein
VEPAAVGSFRKRELRASWRDGQRTPAPLAEDGEMTAAQSHTSVASARSVSDAFSDDHLGISGGTRPGAEHELRKIVGVGAPVGVPGDRRE